MSPEAITKTPKTDQDYTQDFGQIASPEFQVDQKPLPEQALQMYDHMPSEHRKALVRANAAVEYVTETHPEVILHSTEDPIGHKRGIHLISEDLKEEKDIEINHLGFEVYENLLSGKIESAHAVLPGTLTYDAEVRNGSSESKSACQQVAIKGYSKRDFEERLQRVNVEIAASNRMLELGEVGFKPVAVIITPPYLPKDGKEDTIFLLTELEDEIVTLDNAPWHLGPEQGDNLVLLDKAIDALARFNQRVGKHGDCKLKNFAQSADGRVSPIDFETSKIFTEGNFEQGTVAIDIAETDMGLFLKSLNDAGFFRNQDKYKKDELVTHILERYVAHWSDSDDQVQEAVLNGAIKASEILETTM